MKHCRYKVTRVAEAISCGSEQNLSQQRIWAERLSSWGHGLLFFITPVNPWPREFLLTECKSNSDSVLLIIPQYLDTGIEANISEYQTDY